MKIQFGVPTFLLPKRLRDDLEQRSALTGRASRGWFGNWLGGGIEVGLTISNEKSPAKTDNA